PARRRPPRAAAGRATPTGTSPRTAGGAPTRRRRGPTPEAAVPPTPRPTPRRRRRTPPPAVRGRRGPGPGRCRRCRRRARSRRGGAEGSGLAAADRPAPDDKGELAGQVEEEGEHGSLSGRFPPAAYSSDQPATCPTSRTTIQTPSLPGSRATRRFTLAPASSS